MRYLFGFSMVLLLLLTLAMASIGSPVEQARLEGFIGGTGLICAMSGGIVMLYLAMTRTTLVQSDNNDPAIRLLRYRHRTFYSGAVLLVIWFFMTHPKLLFH